MNWAHKFAGAAPVAAQLLFGAGCQHIGPSQEQKTEVEVTESLEGSITATQYAWKDFVVEVDRLEHIEDIGVVEAKLRVRQGEVERLSQPLAGATKVAVDLRDQADVTGDGEPDLVVEDFSMGAHCCFSYEVLSFSPDFTHAATLLGEHGEIEFANFDEDASLEMKAADWVFAYWGTSFAESLVFGMWFELRDGQVTVLEAQMRAAPPSAEAWQAFKAEINAAWDERRDLLQVLDSRVPKVLLEHTGRLIYSGNGADAMRLMRDAWRGEEGAGLAVREAFVEQLTGSMYWEGLAAMNGWTGLTSAEICGAEK